MPPSPCQKRGGVVQFVKGDNGMDGMETKNKAVGTQAPGDRFEKWKKDLLNISLFEETKVFDKDMNYDAYLEL